MISAVRLHDVVLTTAPSSLFALPGHGMHESTCEWRCCSCTQPTSIASNPSSRRHKFHTCRPLEYKRPLPRLYRSFETLAEELQPAEQSTATHTHTLLQPGHSAPTSKGSVRTAKWITCSVCLYESVCMKMKLLCDAETIIYILNHVCTQPQLSYDRSVWMCVCVCSVHANCSDDVCYSSIN